MKVGIVTHYYKSINYGGNLQAYALCKVLNNLGINSEQVCISDEEAIDSSQKIGRKKISPIRIAKKIIAYVLRKIKSKKQLAIRKKAIKKYDYLKRREDAFSSFNFAIPHSDKIYNKSNIKESEDDYYMFITGSDQVWNLTWLPEIFLLTFVSKKEKKLSYAASIPMLSLTEKQYKIFEDNLAKFKAVSVREASSVNLLSKIVRAEQVLDPTLLVSKDDWDKVCEEIQIGEKYIFCYFLGTNKMARRVAKKYAKASKMKIVNIPYASGVARINDANYGDYNLFDVSPQQFVGLIKNAECIFTDSFHAVIFSHIYKKQYFVFNRSKKSEMSSRIYSITNLFKTEQRFCKNKKETRVNRLISLKKINYDIELDEFNKIKEKSINFLTKNIK